jgi:hypothetical protein
VDITADTMEDITVFTWAIAAAISDTGDMADSISARTDVISDVISVITSVGIMGVTSVTTIVTDGASGMDVGGDTASVRAGDGRRTTASSSGFATNAL